MYEIIGEYRGNQEVLDETDSYVTSEYQMAFGSEWAIWIS